MANPKQIVLDTKNSDNKIGLWTGNSGLELSEVCKSSSNVFDVLLIEALQVAILNKGNIFQLKMLNMGIKYSNPFPHPYSYLKGKNRGAGYAEYYDARELEKTLKVCKDDMKIKMMVQLSFIGVTRMRRRQVILLSMMIWNSFFEGNVDRPFGTEFIFDGINFVYDKNSEDIALEVMREMRRTELMTESKKNLIVGSSGGKYLSDLIVSESDFVIVLESVNEKSIPTKTPFVVQSATTFEKKIQEKFKSHQMYRGILCTLGSKERFSVLKKLFSSNPKAPSCGIVVVGIIVMVVSIVIILAYLGYKYKSKLLLFIENKSIIKLDEIEM